jgi:hypothetical protein
MTAVILLTIIGVVLTALGGLLSGWAQKPSWLNNTLLWVLIGSLIIISALVAALLYAFGKNGDLESRVDSLQSTSTSTSTSAPSSMPNPNPPPTSTTPSQTATSEARVPIYDGTLFFGSVDLDTVGGIPNNDALDIYREFRFYELQADGSARILDGYGGRIALPPTAGGLTPEACEAQAASSSRDEIELSQGESMCVTSNSGRVALLSVTSVSEDGVEAQVTVWEPRN